MSAMAARSIVAIDILLQALPSNSANTIESQLSYTPLAPSSTHSPTASTSTSLLLSSATSQTTSAARSTVSTSQSSVTAAATSAFVSPLASNASATPAPPITTSNQGLSAGVIAGIVAGSVSAMVLILLFLLCCLRLRRRRSESHARGTSQSSLLGSVGSVKGSLRRGMQSLRGDRPKVYPEVAWLYDPRRPGSDEQSLKTNPHSGPRMGANDPWSSRPNTSSDRQQMSEVPRQAGKLPHITVARNIDTSFIGTDQEIVHRPAHPYQPQPTSQARGEEEQEEEAEEDMVSPLLPPTARRLSSGNQQRQYGYHHESPYQLHGRAAHDFPTLLASQGSALNARRSKSPPVTLQTPSGPATYRPTGAI